MNQRFSFEVVGRRKLWYSISLVVILAGMGLVSTGNIRWGIDFTGGGIFRYRFAAEHVPPADQQTTVINQVRQHLHSANITTGTIQFSGRDELYVRTSARNDAERKAESRRIVDVLAEQYPGIEELGSEVVGPVIGKDLAAKAIIGVVLGCLLIAVWIWTRYNFMGEGLRYSVCGIAALVHDVFVLLGVFALACKLNLRIEADSAFVAALLTVVGYSINDTVVIFDRIRENLHLRRRDPYAMIVNDSLMQTMTRSINTVLTVELTLLALFFLGGETIHSFILALVIGVTAGTYSSIFVAGPMLVSWKSLDDRKRLAAVPTRKREEQSVSAPSAAQVAQSTARVSRAAKHVGSGEEAEAVEAEKGTGTVPAKPTRSDAHALPAPGGKKKSKGGKRKRRY